MSSGSVNGSDLGLGICPVADYWMYYKFDLASINGEVTAAELRLTRTSGTRPEEISLYHIADDSWSEATLSGLNRPDPVNPPNSAVLATGLEDVGHDRWSSALLADAVNADATSDNLTTLMLRVWLSIVASRVSSCMGSMDFRTLGGMPKRNGSKGTSSMKPPHFE